MLYYFKNTYEALAIDAASLSRKHVPTSLCNTLQKPAVQVCRIQGLLDQQLGQSPLPRRSQSTVSSPAYDTYVYCAVGLA